MAIRWVHRGGNLIDELDLRLMTLRDIWAVIYNKDKEITYAMIERELQAQGFRPVAIDDKQIAYYAYVILETKNQYGGLLGIELTGEEFFEKIYQPFGSDEFLIQTPNFYDIERKTFKNPSSSALQDVSEEEEKSAFQNHDKGLRALFPKL